MFLLVDQMGTRIDQGKTTFVALIDKGLYRTGLDDGVITGFRPAGLTFVICFEVG